MSTMKIRPRFLVLRLGASCVVFVRFNGYLPQDFANFSRLVSRHPLSRGRCERAAARRSCCSRTKEQAFANHVTACLFRAWRRNRDIQVNASATRAVPFARLDVVDRGWRRRLPGLPFPAARSSRNEPVRLDQRFSEDRLPALRVAGGDAMQLRLPPAAQLLPSERRYLHTPRHPGP